MNETKISKNMNHHVQKTVRSHRPFFSGSSFETDRQIALPDYQREIEELTSCLRVRHDINLNNYVFVSGTLIFDLRNGLIIGKSKTVEISSSSIRLLNKFLSQPQMIISKDELLEALCDEPLPYLTDNRLASAIKRLRLSLLQQSSVSFIRTRARLGYMWEATVTVQPRKSLETLKKAQS